MSSLESEVTGVSGVPTDDVIKVIEESKSVPFSEISSVDIIKLLLTPDSLPRILH